MKKIAIILGVVIVVLLGILFFVPSSKAPEIATKPPGGISPDGHVVVVSPVSNSIIISPIDVIGSVTGGGWFFEASFPIKIIDADGTVLGRGQAQAQPPEDWMSTGIVPFSATVAFVQPHSATGRIVLSKDNPSGLSQNDASLSIPVSFEKATSTAAGGGGSGGGAGSGTSTAVTGNVVLGPTCPVERIPPDPNCAPRPYQTKVDIYMPVGSPEPYKTLTTSASGTFSVKLAPGTYFFQPRGGATKLPRCSGMEVTVPIVGISDITLQCDTGIR